MKLHVVLLTESNLDFEKFIPGNHIIFSVPRTLVMRGDITPLLEYFEIMSGDPYRFRDSITILFSEWNDDPREFIEIPEIVSYYRKLDEAFPYLPLFLSKQSINGHHAFNMYLGVMTNSQIIARGEGQFFFQMDNAPLAEIITARIRSIGDLVEKVGMSNEKIQTIFDSIVAAVKAN